MANKLVNMRMSTELLKAVDDTVEEGLYSSRSAFIKEVVRKRVEEYRERKALKLLERYYGEGKRRGLKEPTDEDIEKVKEAVWKERHP